MEYKRSLKIGVDDYTENEVVLDVYGSVNISKNVNVAGTITYDDVTNVDSIGLITARSGIDVNGTLNVSGLSTFQNNVRLLDNDRLLFGTDGDDLQIYHNGFYSWIDANPSQRFYIINNDVRFTDVGNNQLVRIIGNPEGIVQLSYRGALAAAAVKFETTGYGVSVYGGGLFTGISTFQNDVNIGVGGTTAFFDVSTGYVGIGSTQPIAKLDVAGDVNITGIVTATKFVGELEVEIINPFLLIGA